MSSTTYPTRQPITGEAISMARAAFIAGLLSAHAPSRGVALGPCLPEIDSPDRFPLPVAAPVRQARVIVTEKPSEALVERMAADMRLFGEGMTRADLKRLGYTDRQLAACAEEAARRARMRSGLN